MPEQPSPTRPTALKLLGELHVEIGIVVFCAAIISETGKTKGPVFDTVGPDLLPTAVATIVAALTALQIVVHVARRRWEPDSGPGVDTVGLRNGAIFALATLGYVAALASRQIPFFVATCAFMAVATALLSQHNRWRDAALGAAIGLGLGLFLQFIFTQVLIIDLPG
ncbi:MULTISPECIES: tripartite tricarboxylate transporter TctB family protein [unclassified Roseitalea]|uniref:tripartite tricarboxylate transporter TctB family protein n=1 Tax=unclassified Roseitalea TaxID=2639107 RepID=UPI00273F3C50|nr:MULTISPECIES: tripartite tricarboxylate transporter TctB family protein [unclassified Roseitalea]